MASTGTLTPLPRLRGKGWKRVVFLPLITILLSLCMIAVTARTADALVLEGAALAAVSGSTSVASGGAGLAGGATAVGGGGAVAACVATVVCAVAVVAGALVVGGLVYYAVSEANRDQPSTSQYWYVNDLGRQNGKLYLSVETNCVYPPEAYWNEGSSVTNQSYGYLLEPWKTEMSGNYLAPRTHFYEVPAQAGSFLVRNTNCSSFGKWDVNAGTQDSAKLNPARMWRTVTTCKNEAGDAQKVNWVSQPFTEAQPPLPPIQRGECPAGFVPTLIEIFKVIVDTGVATLIDSITIKPQDKNDPCSLWAGNHACDPTIWSNQGTNADPDWEQCGTTVGCEYTTAIPNGTGEDVWQCRYGNAIVALGLCENLKRPPGTRIEPGEDTKPEEKTPAPAPRPNPTPGPGSPTDPKPEDPANPTGDPTPPVDNVIQCAPSGWQILNPLAYVYGMGCVLVWAVVPPPSTFELFEPLVAQIQTVPPVSWAVDIVDWLGPVLIPPVCNQACVSGFSNWGWEVWDGWKVYPFGFAAECNQVSSPGNGPGGYCVPDDGTAAAFLLDVRPWLSALVIMSMLVPFFYYIARNTLPIVAGTGGK